VGVKLDRFTWAVIGLVALLLIAAVATVNLRGGAGNEELAYVTEDAPATPVTNAFIALQKGDPFKAREQYSTRVLDEMKDSGLEDPFNRTYYSDSDSVQRLRIVSVQVNENDPDEAAVTFVVDTYQRRGGPFGGGATWSNRRTVQVVREDGQWKIDTAEMFY
jgi:hypothetical protein